VTSKFIAANQKQKQKMAEYGEDLLDLGMLSIPK